MIAEIKKKVLLIYPELPDNFWAMKHLMKITGKKSAFPPLGLLTVASILPSDWDIKLIDLNVQKLDETQISNYDFVFISAMNVQSSNAKKVIKKIKEHNAVIVAGGPLFTHEYEDFPDVDHFILNEAEITLPMFLEDLENGKLKKIYKTEKFVDIQTSPLPKWNIIDFKNYAYSIVQYSRGCPYLCDFCDVTALFGRVPRVKTNQQIIAELDEIIRHGNPEMILFADDNLIGNKNALKKDLLPELIKWRSKNKYAPGFATQVTINLADDYDLMKLMLEAGFRHIFIGIETPDEKSLFESKKKQNLKRNLTENVQYLQNNGFIITGGFIVGFDSDDETIFSRQEKFINESGIVIATINALKAPPGTELYEKMKVQNRLKENFDFDENKSNIVLKMNQDVFNDGFHYLIKSVYSPEFVWKRAKTALLYSFNTKVSIPIKRKIALNDFSTLVRIFWFIGIKEKTRKYFWKLLFFILLNKPKRIINSFLFSVLMYQFQKMYERYLESIHKDVPNLDSPKAILQNS